MNELKKKLREELLEEIGNLTDAYIADSNAGIFENLIALPEYQRATTIFAYCSVKREIDTSAIIDHALAQGKTVALPVCAKCGVMEARAIGCRDELCPAGFDLLEPLNSEQVILPSALDFIIVPALAYDDEGFRLGWGGGYYDRFLSGLSAFTAGLAREKLLRPALPHESHDVPVRCVVTEKKARLLTGASQ